MNDREEWNGHCNRRVFRFENRVKKELINWSMSSFMKKTAFAYAKTKALIRAVIQYRESDQHFCFRYIDCTIGLNIRNFKLVAIS